ncbi:MAG: hypothetical protein V7776_17015 [Halopseudomonas aestusnigri]
MSVLKVRCISTKPYLQEQPNGEFLEGEFEGDMISLTLNRIYKVLEEDKGFYRIIDNTEEDYWFPTTMFEVVDS